VSNPGKVDWKKETTFARLKERDYYEHKQFIGSV
jgi:hypothetical protein